MRYILGIVPLLGMISTANASPQEGPRLVPPSEESLPLTTTLSPGLSSPTAPPPTPGNGPELIVPGLPGSVARPNALPSFAPVQAPINIPLEAPANQLVKPITSPVQGSSSTPLIMPPLSSSTDDSPYLPIVTSEPIPATAAPRDLTSLPLESIPSLGETTRSPVRPERGPRPGSVQLPEEPRRGSRIGGLIGRIFGQEPPGPRQPIPSRHPLSETNPLPGRTSPSMIVLDDEELRNRLERLIFSATDGQVQALEILIDERRVHIRAKVDRFWQRRGVQRRIETLPALSKFQTTVEVH